MTNNDILRRLRYTYDYTDEQVINIFALGGLKATRAQISDWLRKEEEEENQKQLLDVGLASFLNGMIVLNRGKREGVEMVAEHRINNNIIFKKLRIALSLKDVDILRIYDLVGASISEHELSAFFRKPSQRQYRPCMDQFLRNFLQGLQKMERGL